MVGVRQLAALASADAYGAEVVAAAVRQVPLSLAQFGADDDLAAPYHLVWA